MGGNGSGRYSGYCTHYRTDHYLKLDIRHWQRKSLLGPKHAFNWQWSRDGKVTNSILVAVGIDLIVLIDPSSKQDEVSKDKIYVVELLKTACHLGGERVWFKCPAKGCSRRVAILYWGPIFACRHCYRLVYATQRQNSMYRALSRAEKIRDRLGWDGGAFDGCGLKPKGMHWRTYQRFCSKHNVFSDRTLLDARLRFGT